MPERETTLSPDVIRQALFDGRWLVLIDTDVTSRFHTCGGGVWPWTEEPRYDVFTCSGFKKCCRSTSCSARISSDDYANETLHDSLSEANAAFDELERKMIAGEAG